MLKIIVIIIGAIAVGGFSIVCYYGGVVNDLKRHVGVLDSTTIKTFGTRSKDWDMTAARFRQLEKVLHEQGIATDYISEHKLDFSECKKTDKEYKKEADSLINSVKTTLLNSQQTDDSDKFENLTIFEEIEVGPLKKDPREKQFRCNKCSTVYPLNITVQHNIKYCSYCGKKIAYFKFLDYWKD